MGSGSWDATRSARLVVMGDTGVGKSKVLEKLCNGSGGSGLQAWVKAEKGMGGGCDVWEFIEMDGGVGSHVSVRYPMFQKIDGIVLVYDLTDDASACSLQQWYGSYVEYEGGGGELDTSPPQDSGVYHHHTSRVYSRSAPRMASSSYIPVCVIGTHSDQAQKAPPNPRSLCRRISKKLLSLQRTLASILRQALFLPMPSFLASTGGADVVVDSFRVRPNTRVLEWSCYDSPTTEIDNFLHTVLDAKQPTV